MFGYIRPMECELKVREQATYRAYYCGLCKAIGRRYGQGARLALNYDCAFLAELLDAMEGEPRLSVRRCAPRFYKGEQLMADDAPALQYAADVNVLLAYYQYADDWNDEKRMTAAGAKALLGGASRKAAKHRPALADAISQGIERLSAIERAGEPGTDAPADAFGSLLRDVVSLYPGLMEENRASAAWMFYNLGRWIYLADAWEDREKDRKRGSFNPFNASKTELEDARFLLSISLFEAEKAYDLLTLAGDAGVTDNVMHLGCRHKTCLLLTPIGKENAHEPV